MICDNCKRGAVTHRVKKEIVQTEFQLSWPPIKKSIKEEWWCKRCYYSDFNGAAPADVRRNMHKGDSE